MRTMLEYFWKVHCRIAAAVDILRYLIVLHLNLGAEGGYTVPVPEYACPTCSTRKSDACESQRG